MSGIGIRKEKARAQLGRPGPTDREHRMVAVYRVVGISQIPTGGGNLQRVACAGPNELPDLSPRR